MRRDVFQAIADPTRRRIINILSKKSLNLNGVADKFDISRPAISKHIKILTECGIIIIKQKGRERYCEANLKSFDKVSQWVDQCRTFWTSKLDALEIFLNEEKIAEKKLNKMKKLNSSSKNKKS
ncbi:MAG TPA: metalloregulator ArsR/SmtB family transcription factor [Puia sp.]|jgi:DNA-binding transcriptional ArsR family regulator|nr:metalloregulator ArsR/SmtB family transcription factor [Puia sp.]